MATEVIAKCTDKFTVKHKTTKIVKTSLNIGSALSRRLNARDLQALRIPLRLYVFSGTLVLFFIIIILFRGVFGFLNYSF